MGGSDGMLQRRRCTPGDACTGRNGSKTKHVQQAGTAAAAVSGLRCACLLPTITGLVEKLLAQDGRKLLLDEFRTSPAAVQLAT